MDERNRRSGNRRQRERRSAFIALGITVIFALILISAIMIFLKGNVQKSKTDKKVTRESKTEISTEIRAETEKETENLEKSNHTETFETDIKKETDEAVEKASIIPEIEKKTGVVTEINYADIYNSAIESISNDVSRMGGDSDWLQYALYDMNHDGILEFLIQKGTCNADMGYEIYTTDGSNCIYLGQALGQAQVIYTAPEKNGFYTYFGRQWVVTINEVTLENGKIRSDTYFSGEDENYENEYEVLQQQIKTRTLGEPMVWEASEIVDADITEEYIFPDSNTEYLSYEEVAGKSQEELLYGRNEIYARHGYIFQDEAIRAHFENTSWYTGVVPGEQFDASVFNEYENANLNLILEVENGNENPMLVHSYNFDGRYISGTGSDSPWMDITQNGDTVSYTWYSGDAIVDVGYDIPINEDGSVSTGSGAFWLEGDTELFYTNNGDGMTLTFWRVR